MRTVIVSLSVLASACTAGQTEATASVESMSTTTAPPTTSSTLVTTTTVAPTTTTTVATDRVGSREVMLEEMRAAWEANQFTYDWAFEDAYIPDLQNPDPLVALEELIRFTEFLERSGGSDLWWDVFNVKESPALELWRAALRRTEGIRWVEADDNGQPFAVNELRVASSDEAGTVPDEVIGQAPEGSVLLYYSGSDPDGVVEVFAPTGEIVGSSGPYNVERLVMLSPSPSGWAYFWGDWGE